MRYRFHSQVGLVAAAGLLAIAAAVDYTSKSVTEQQLSNLVT